MTLADDLRQLREGVGAAVVARDVVRVHGPEAIAWLQGQLSQDVAGLPLGASAPTFVLQPQGKVDVWMRATRTADDAVVFDTDPGWGGALVERLSRFKLRTKAEIEVLDWSMLVVRGPEAAEPEASPGGIVVQVDPTDELPGGWDVLGADPVVPSGVPEVDPAALEVLRIEGLIPRMGAEIDQTTIPAETGVVGSSVSFTKGCYTGQELVARVDSRGGRAPRRVVRLRLAGEAELLLPAAVARDGQEIGRITSAVPDGRGGLVALGLLARAVDVPCDVELVGGVHARVDAEGPDPAS
jgi:folate-binding protein YgfZ